MHSMCLLICLNISRIQLGVNFYNRIQNAAMELYRRKDFGLIFINMTFLYFVGELYSVDINADLLTFYVEFIDIMYTLCCYHDNFLFT